MNIIKIKDPNAYKTFGEVAQIVGLIDKKKGTLSTHTIRFWEKEFKQIKPKIFAGKRRFYDSKTIDLIKNIKFLLKDKGMTIKGVKKILNVNTSLKLDETNDFNVQNNSINKKIIKTKVTKILEIIEDLKKIKHG